jgi:integrase/recombinase XerD
VADRRHLKRKPLSAVVTLTPGSLGAWGVRYLEDLAVRNYSPFTIRGEEKNLCRFVPWCEERDVKEPGAITVPLLERYQRHLFHQVKADGKRLSFHSQYDRLGTIRRFLHWLVRQRVLAMNPAASLDPPRVERRLPKAILSAFEAEQILKTPDVTTPKGLRDRAILELLYATGIRRHEIAALRIDDIDLDNGRLVVRQGKGKKDRMLPLSERAGAWLEKYLEEARFRICRGPDDGALFITHFGKRMIPEQMTKIVRRAIDAAEISKPGACHLFRHTMATLMLEGGADLRYVQAMLGHADITSTQIYTRVAIGKLKEVYERSHPAAKLGRKTSATAKRERVEDPRAELLEQLASEDDER